MDFTIGFSVGIITMMVVAGPIIYRANTTLRILHQECGMAAEQIKFADCEGFQRLDKVMSYAEKRHRGLRFVEQRFVHDRFFKD